ncbi:hypothetical protein [Clostridium beijerinckii]|uniref:hypothetical protein n=1 Tax=Clostridium beijerinckii TaxID=1520 RepID=UPI0009D2D64C|nr:hypothetical protein [Clostridium beijerinckii]MBA8937260.1 hypothetical protein [Clostridium beijerinckii]NRU40274.1 hypothetical protein [Clostridium beijerinckii]NSA96449.1 hypothetical protein [Clostridium beijerinckii]OOM60645.1 hypothetical protein CLOBI_29330 [Clostridium beijerinckii]OOM68567.1 hypothetical protein CLBEIC_32240 [Clostridium beijerinckii]
MDDVEVNVSEVVDESNNINSESYDAAEDNEENQSKKESDNKEETIVASQTTVNDEPTYSIQEFIDNSEALGYKKEVVAGALFSCKKSELTKTEFEAMVKEFLGKKVE